MPANAEHDITGRLRNPLQSSVGKACHTPVLKCILHCKLNVKETCRDMNIKQKAISAISWICVGWHTINRFLHSVDLQSQHKESMPNSVLITWWRNPPLLLSVSQNHNCASWSLEVSFLPAAWDQVWPMARSLSRCWRETSPVIGCRRARRAVFFLPGCWRLRWCHSAQWSADKQAVRARSIFWCFERRRWTV